MTGFVIYAGVMVLIALAFIVRPLLRANRHVDPDAARTRALEQALANGVISAEEYASKKASFQIASSVTLQRSRSGYVALLLTVLLLPALAIFAYSRVGTPHALDPAARQAEPVTGDGGIDMDQAVAGLAAKLEKNPNDAQGWALLGRAYQSMQKPQQAMDAFKRARALLTEDPDLMADYAQALVTTSGGTDFSGEPSQLLDRALSIQPDNQRALWLRGVAQYQAGDYPTSIGTWTHLLGLLPAGSTVGVSVQAQIDDARGKAGMPATVATTPATPKPAAPGIANAPKLTVSVSIDPSIAAQVDPSLTVFVYARAASGPPMPLAIQRLSVAQLPVTITLDDSNGMMPNMKLSNFPQVVVGARISRSGNPIAQSGDWQTLSEPIDVGKKETVVLTIDRIVP